MSFQLSVSQFYSIQPHRCQCSVLSQRAWAWLDEFSTHCSNYTLGVAADLHNYFFCHCIYHMDSAAQRSCLRETPLVQTEDTPNGHIHVWPYIVMAHVVMIQAGDAPTGCTSRQRPSGGSMRRAALVEMAEKPAARLLQEA